MLRDHEVKVPRAIGQCVLEENRGKKRCRRELSIGFQHTRRVRNIERKGRKACTIITDKRRLPEEWMLAALPTD